MRRNVALYFVLLLWPLIAAAAGPASSVMCLDERIARGDTPRLSLTVPQQQVIVEFVSGTGVLQLLNNSTPPQVSGALRPGEVALLGSGDHLLGCIDGDCSCVRLHFIGFAGGCPANKADPCSVRAPASTKKQ